jgi:hypothetical protein
MEDIRKELFDCSWWERELRSVLAIEDPVLCNLRITLAHYKLSLALHHLLGPDTGANFHTWAVWGSKKAGMTIRRQDMRRIRPIAMLVGVMLGALSATTVGRGLGQPLVRAGVGTVLGGVGFSELTRRLLDRTVAHILGGNRTVLDDIGHVTARFLCSFHGSATPDPARLDAFVASLRSGDSRGGGQDLLKQAFTHYYMAWHEPNLDAKHEHMLYANLQAILHEHLRLDPYIDGAILRPLRRAVTARLLRYRVGNAGLSVAEDVPAWVGSATPSSLELLAHPELLDFLVGSDGWDRTPDNLSGSRARDWTDIRDRMNYIVDLFRTRHFDPELFLPPLTEEQSRTLLAGRVPGGPL